MVTEILILISKGLSIEKVLLHQNMLYSLFYSFFALTLEFTVPQVVIADVAAEEEHHHPVHLHLLLLQEPPAFTVLLHPLAHTEPSYLFARNSGKPLTKLSS